MCASSMKAEGHTTRNAAGQPVYQYTRRETWLAGLLLLYLIVAFMFGFWAMADAFHGRSTLVRLFMGGGAAANTGDTTSTPAPASTLGSSENAPGTKAAEVSGTPVPTTIPTPAESVPGTNAADTLFVLVAGAGCLGGSHFCHAQLV